MTAISFFTDEDIYGSIAALLRRAGFDAVSTPEVARIGETDDSQLLWATDHSRVLVTFNVAHFAALHRLWLQQGRQHVGVVVSCQRPIGDTLRRLLHLANTRDAAAMSNRLEFLSDW